MCIASCSRSRPLPKHGNEPSNLNDAFVALSWLRLVWASGPGQGYSNAINLLRSYIRSWIAVSAAILHLGAFHDVLAWRCYRIADCLRADSACIGAAAHFESAAATAAAEQPGPAGDSAVG